MRIGIQRKIVATLGIVAIALGMAGCGGSAPQPTVPVERHIYTSANDCAEEGKLPLETCSKLIEAAIAQHVATAPTYGSLRSCEKVEGPEKCERTDMKTFRPMLSAFLFALGEVPVAFPLYPTLDGKAGFRKLDKQVLQGDDEAITFSRQAVAAYEQHLGKAAADTGSSAF